jgi:hypothetical protein
VKVSRDTTLDDVGRQLVDFGSWAIHKLFGAQPGPGIPSSNAIGIITVGVIALVVGLFLYWCVSDWRKKRKGERAYGKRRPKRKANTGGMLCRKKPKKGG